MQVLGSKSSCVKLNILYQNTILPKLIIYLSLITGYVLSKGAVSKAVEDGIHNNVCDAKDESFGDIGMGK